MTVQGAVLERTDAYPAGVDDDLRQSRLKARVILGCVWGGPLLCLFFGLGFAVIAGFVPPTNPNASAQQIRDFYLENINGIRVGMLLSAIGVAFLAPWGTAIAYLLRRARPHHRILTHAQLVCTAAGTAVGLLIPIVWGVVAFRPDEYPAGTILAFHDFGWFLFLFSWPVFSVWCVVYSAAVLLDESEQPIFPRWTAYLSFWVAFAFIADGLIIFFKSGPFSYHGLMSFYVATAGFFAWVVVLSWYAIRALRRDLTEVA
jgi:hypothetical protein